MKQKLRILEKKKYRIERLNFDYTPSPDAFNFHASLARFRFLIWGIKSGKTAAGAAETARGILGSKPGSLSWVVAPTYAHLDEAERVLLKILYSFPGMIKRRNRNKREFLLKGDRILQCKSADNPDNLRGPNVDGIAWFDEAAFGKDEAHYILRERVAATGAPIIYTTTPRGRNLLWREVQIGGMPPDQPYGEFFADTDDGGYFVSHRPTWHFPWVPKSEIEALRKRMPKVIFEQELGAQFITKESQIFHHIEERMSMELPLVSSDAGTIMGVDLARYQDWTAIVIMTPGGRVVYIDRWNDTEWTVQRPRILRLAKRWNSVIVLDKANVGSVIEEDLRNEGAEVFAIEMNSPAVKADLIQSLQLAFETGAISIPDPKAEWANEHALQMYRELSWYEGGITTGGRMTYSAPKGLSDDLPIALSLANWGRARAVAVGTEGAEVAISAEDFERILDESDDDDENEEVNESEGQGKDGMAKRFKTKEPRLPVFKSVFSRGRSRLGFESMNRSLWEEHPWD